METIVIDGPDARTAPKSQSSTTPDIYLVQPGENEPVEADLVTFVWKGNVPGASYRLQVASDATFQNLFCDVPVGDATLLTLHAAFAEIGTAYFWRVGMDDGTGRLAWSQAAQFRAATEIEVRAYQPQSRAQVSTAKDLAKQAPQPATEAHVIAPHLTGTTSGREAAAFFSLMVISFTVTLAILLYFSATMPG